MTDILKAEEEFLRQYDVTKFAKPNTSVDTAIFTVIDNDLHVLTVKRAEHPYQDSWSLVGGFIDILQDDDLESTAKRKLEEKTGVKTPYLEQLGTVGNKLRDPRGWSVTTVYFALIPHHNVSLRAGHGALDIKWSKVVDKKVKHKLAFDHADLLARCIERLRSKVLYTSIPVYLMASQFTLRELQTVYEIILNKTIDHKAFRRRILSVDLLEKTNEMLYDGKRPAALYRIKKSKSTHFFVRNMAGGGE